MASKSLHPHTHAVMTAARHLDAVAKLLGEGPKFMETEKSMQTKAILERLIRMDQKQP